MKSVNSDEILNRGMLYAFIAYLGWGFFPIYWKLLKHVPYVQILSHRVVWSFVFYSIVLMFIEKKFYFYKPVNLKIFKYLFLASCLLMSNWLVYIYAVNSNQIIESSLGYFINPLVNILLGVFLLKEKLKNFQKVASVLALIGVSIITLDQGKIPWIALFLAGSFSLYGLIKKTISVDSLKSNQFESFIMLPLGVFFIFKEQAVWMTPDNTIVSLSLLVGSGLVTGLPLIFFSSAAQKIPYYLMGFFQFIAPSLQFLSGVLLFDESISQIKLIGFVFIWGAGILLLVYSWWYSRTDKGVG